MACKAQGQGTIKVVERTTPAFNAPKMASFTELHIPKSSALMISRRASAGYPSNRFVWLFANMIIFALNLLCHGQSEKSKLKRNALHS